MADADHRLPARAELGLPSALRVHRVWLIAGVWVLLFALALPFDAAITNWFQNLAPEGTYLRRVFKVPAHLFIWQSFFVVAGVLLLHPRRWHLLVGYALPLLIAFGGLWLMKPFIGRARPDVMVDGVDVGPYIFAPLSGYDAFPSGHATQSVLLAVLLGIYFPRSRWLFFPAALLVCLGRLALDRHYPTDVLGGAGLALLSVYLSTRILDESFYGQLWPRPPRNAAHPPAERL